MPVTPYTAEHFIVEEDNVVIVTRDGWVQAAGLNRPDIGILSEEFLEDVRHMKERNLAVELLERLLKDDIRSRFRTNVVQQARFSELLQQSLQRYRNHWAVGRHGDLRALAAA